MSVVNPPKNWGECRELLGSHDFDLALQVRLVELAFSDNGSVAVKAIDMLRAMPRLVSDDVLRDIPTDVLIAAEKRANDWINQLD